MTEKRFAEWCQNVRDGNPPGDVPPGLDASVQRKAEAVRVAFDDDGTEAAVRACDAFGLELRSADGTTAPENGLHLLTGLGDDATLADVGGALHAIAASVNGADKLSRALLREGILRELQARGIGAAATMADAALGGQTPGVGVGQGAPVFLETPAPWDEAVDGADMLDELAAVVRRFCVLPDGAADAIALWVVHTYCVDGADITPRLALTSPTKRCGKTTVLSVLGALVNRPLIASNATSAVIFRGIEAFKPTLLLDEADTFLAARDELRGVLNAGHSRTTGFVLRCDGDDHEPRLFGVFTPVAIAMIGALPDTLADRSLEVGMERKAKGVEVERWRVSHAEGLISTCRRCARWAADNHDTLRDADPVVPAALGDRCADNWRPLLAIADTAGGVWPARACCAASLLSGHPDDDSDGDRSVQLLADIRDTFEECAVERIASADLVDALVAMEERPYPEWTRGAPLTARGLARALSGFRIRPRRLRIPGATAGTRGYERGDFSKAWEQYAPPPAALATGEQAPHAPHVNGDGAQGDSGKRHGAQRVAHSEASGHPREHRDVAHVALPSHVVGEDGPADAAKLLAGLLPAGTELHREEVFARAREQGISVDALFRATEDAGVRVVGAVWTGRACDGP